MVVFFYDGITVCPIGNYISLLECRDTCNIFQTKKFKIIGLKTGGSSRFHNISRERMSGRLGRLLLCDEIVKYLSLISIYCMAGFRIFRCTVDIPKIDFFGL